MSDCAATHSVCTSPQRGEVGGRRPPGEGVADSSDVVDRAPLTPPLSPPGRGSRPRLRRWPCLCRGLFTVSLAVAAIAAAAWWIVALGPAPVGEGLAFSTLFVDRDGNLLRPYATPEGRWRLPATRESVDPRLIALILAYEDKRFWTPPRAPPLAPRRALPLPS